VEFRPLASSSSGCCYLVSGGGARAPLLIECGIRFELIQRALDFKVTGLAGCLLSHCHGDHSRSAREVMRAGIDVYAHPETWRALPSLNDCGHRRKDGSERSEFSVGDWRVLPFECVHDVVGTLGFVIGSPDGGRLLYLTDTAYSKYRFDGLTIIAAEANWSEEIIRAGTASGAIHPDRFRRTVRTHMSLEKLIAMLKANDLSKVEEIWLLHLSDQNADEEAFRCAVIRAVGIPTFVAQMEAYRFRRES
jgi:phosphoribosyl 1,2-cyclic phosphodiesterase